jgi:hypothetical protein
MMEPSKPKKAPPARFAATAPKNTTSGDEIPIKPALNLDEMPIGGNKGTYDLDKLLGADAFADPNGGDAIMNEPVTKTKKAPPARFASKKPAESAI